MFLFYTKNIILSEYSCFSQDELDFNAGNSQLRYSKEPFHSANIDLMVDSIAEDDGDKCHLINDD